MNKILYTGGTFDVFHYGHMNFLKQCAKISDKVIVSLNTDEFITQYKGKPPVMNYDERKRNRTVFHWQEELIAPTYVLIFMKPLLLLGVWLQGQDPRARGKARG